MIIDKHIQSQIEVDFLFVQGKINVNSKSLIKKIKKGFKAEDNLSYKTHVQDKMTSFSYFNNDNEFLSILDQFIKYVDTHKKYPKYTITDSWGFQISSGHETTKHDHRTNEWSGVLYLNEHEQTLDFNSIGMKVKPEPGSFALFSSFLEHEAKKHNSPNTKYGISFNLKGIGFETN